MFLSKVEVVVCKSAFEYSGIDPKEVSSNSFVGSGRPELFVVMVPIDIRVVVAPCSHQFSAIAVGVDKQYISVVVASATTVD